MANEGSSRTKRDIRQAGLITMQRGVFTALEELKQLGQFEPSYLHIERSWQPEDHPTQARDQSSRRGGEPSWVDRNCPLVGVGNVDQPRNPCGSRPEQVACSPGLVSTLGIGDQG